PEPVPNLPGSQRQALEQVVEIQHRDAVGRNPGLAPGVSSTRTAGRGEPSGHGRADSRSVGLTDRNEQSEPLRQSARVNSRLGPAAVARTDSLVYWQDPVAP